MIVTNPLYYSFIKILLNFCKKQSYIITLYSVNLWHSAVWSTFWTVSNKALYRKLPSLIRLVFMYWLFETFLILDDLNIDVFQTNVIISKSFVFREGFWERSLSIFTTSYPTRPILVSTTVWVVRLVSFGGLFFFLPKEFERLFKRRT